MKGSTVRRLAMLAAGSAALALAACQGAAPETNIETEVVNLAEPEEIFVENIAEPIAEAGNVTPAPSAPGADLTADEQTLDDADATGMTAKLPRDDGPQPAE